VNPRAPSARPWVRRHPFATGILALSAALFGLMLALPGDEDRGLIVVGISALALPIVAVTWLVTWLIDRRKASRADAAMADASLAPSAIWPPAAAPVTPRDVASLFRTPPAANTTPASTEFGTPAPSETTPSTPRVDAPQDVASLWRTPPAPASQPAAVPTWEPTGALAPDMATADLGTDRPTTLDVLLEMSPEELEQLCVRLLLGLGYADLARTGAAGDLGPVVGRDPLGRSVVVQTIRYTGDTLGTDAVQSFLSTMDAGPLVGRRILMATAEFSQPASRLASEHDVLLIDGETLVKLLDLTGSR